MICFSFSIKQFKVIVLKLLVEYQEDQKDQMKLNLATKFKHSCSIVHQINSNLLKVYYFHQEVFLKALNHLLKVN